MKNVFLLLSLMGTALNVMAAPSASKSMISISSSKVKVGKSVQVTVTPINGKGVIIKRSDLVVVIKKLGGSSDGIFGIPVQNADYTWSASLKATVAGTPMQIGATLDGVALKDSVSLSVAPVAIGKISLSAPSNKITQNACSYDPVKVVYTEAGQNKDVLVSLSSSSSVKFYDDVLCSHEVSELNLKASEGHSKNFYIKNISRGSFSISAIKKSDSSIKSSLALSSMFAITVAPGNDSMNSSSALQKAIDSASASVTKDFVSGPSGAQAIVYLPKGIYRLRSVYMKDNVRLEIDARAVLKNEVPNGGVLERCATYLFFDTKKFDVQGTIPVKNVSIVGVGTDSRKVALSHDPVKWNLTHSFTINHDPVQNECDGSGAMPIMVRNVNGFLIKNIYSIQNNSQPGDSLTMSGSSVVVLKSGMSSKAAKPPYNDPQNGIYENHYNINAISGYGPTQVQSANNVKFSKFFSLGGVAARFETDVAGNFTKCSESEKPCYAKGAKVDNITVDTVECLNGNSGVYLASHNQLNGKINVKNIKSENCYQGIVQSAESETADFKSGSFQATIDNVEIIGSNYSGNGTKAQKPDPAHNTFTPNVKSLIDVGVNAAAKFWAVEVTNCTSKGEFSSKLKTCPLPK